MTDLAQTIATALLACVSTEVAKISAPPAHIRYAVGTDVVHDISTTQDLCCEGLAYVMLGATFWSVDTFPEIDQIRQRSGSCPPPAWAQKFQVGIVRCSPVGDINGIVKDSEWTAAALLNMEDAAALRRIACCIRAWVNAQTGDMAGMSLYVDQQNQVQPQGGCIERHMEITTQFPNQDCACLTGP